MILISFLLSLPQPLCLEDETGRIGKGWVIAGEQKMGN